MKKSFLTMLFFCMISLLSAEESNTILSYEVCSDEDFSLCEQLYYDVYGAQSSLGHEGLRNRFALLKSLAGEHVTFLCLVAEKKAVGFLTIEHVNSEKVALYDSPIVSAYRPVCIEQFGAILKRHFSEAKEVFVVANKQASALIKYVESFGFYPCNDYVPNTLIIPNFEQYQAFKKNIE